MTTLHCAAVSVTPDEVLNKMTACIEPGFVTPDYVCDKITPFALHLFLLPQNKMTLASCGFNVTR